MKIKILSISGSTTSEGTHRKVTISVGKETKTEEYWFNTNAKAEVFVPAELKDIEEIKTAALLALAEFGKSIHDAHS